MAATVARRAGRLLGAAGALLAGCSDAPPGPPPLPAPADGLHLELTVPAPEFAPGAQVPLTFTATNTGAGTCDLPETAVGTVTLRVERDGVPVVPQTRVLLYPDGAGAVVDAARRGVEPGGRVSFVLPATVGSTELPDAGLALSSVTALPTGEGLAAQFALAPGGAYAVTAVYAPGPQGAGRACTSSLNPACLPGGAVPQACSAMPTATRPTTSSGATAARSPAGPTAARRPWTRTARSPTAGG